jgi:hypothetical protein
MGVRLLVCGGRNYHRARRIYDALDLLHERIGVDVLIHGDCPTGADAGADSWAMSRGVCVDPYPADWDAHGRSAGAIRNREMLRRAVPDCAVAFPGGPGTANMVGLIEAAGIPLLRFWS